MDKRNKTWFKGIDLPRDETTLEQGVDYLDRLIGKGPPQRQFFRPTKRPQNQNTTTKKQNKTIVKTTKLANVTCETKMDDAKWLEERRKKFPKVGDTDQQEQPSAKLDQPICQEASITLKREIPLKRRNKKGIVKSFGNNKPVQTRKKTLFEKLMAE